MRSRALSLLPRASLATLCQDCEPIAASSSRLACLVSLRDFSTSSPTPSWRSNSVNAQVAAPASPLSPLPASASAALLLGRRSFASSAQQQHQQYEKQVVYKGRGMKLFRVLVRLKVFQLAGVAALAVPITTVLSGAGHVSGLQAVVCASLVFGSGAASTALWFYSRRYIGELSLLRLALSSKAGGSGDSSGGSGEATGAAGSTSAGAAAGAVSAGGAAAAAGDPLVRLSVLDFWGNRENNDIPLQRFVAPMAGLSPGQRNLMADEMLIPVDIEGDRQYYLSVRYGQVVDPSTLRQLLCGELPEQVAAAADADAAAAAVDERALGGRGARG